MAKWQGNWQFKKPLHPKDGKQGTANVDAADEAAAKRWIQLVGSRTIFDGDPSRHAQFFVTDILKLA